MAIWERMANDIAALPLPKNFHVIELGSQVLAYDPVNKQPASLLYSSLGCGRYESIDGNRRGTILHDLNLPYAQAGFDTFTFDLVTDFGTGEHIFDQAQVWRTIHALTKVGGFIGIIRPEQGYPGHSFYRTDECLFRDVGAANAYEILKLEHVEASRGMNILVFYRRTKKGDFRIPQQGRYDKDLRPLKK